jgi:excisionase family DNA binding protein
VALTSSDARIIGEVVRRLRAEHADREAAAIERLVQQALVVSEAEPALAGYMTTGDAARVIGVSLQTVKNWVRQGRLVGSRVGGRMLVTRASVQAFFDALGSAPEQPEPAELNVAEGADRELVASVPREMSTRVEALLERRRSGPALSPAERQELRRLARAGRTAATRRTRNSASRRPRSS